jgi:hypothetical protein
MSSPASGTYRAVRLVKLSKTMEEGIAALELQTLPVESLGSTEVRVQVHASAMNVRNETNISRMARNIGCSILRMVDLFACSTLTC